MRKIIIGIDEVGRGSWAGPLFFGAVCFLKKTQVPPDVIIRDSKALSRTQREYSSYFLRKNVTFAIARVPGETVDRIGLQRATIHGLLTVMRKIRRKIVASLPALDRGGIQLHYKIDGTRLCDIHESHEFIVRGDSKIREISAASIVAKVARDRLLMRLSKVYPGYGFDSHVGYGTKKHQLALEQHGICAIHRTSYAPIRRIILKNRVESGEK